MAADAGSQRYGIIVYKANVEEIKARLKVCREAILSDLVERLCAIGEECVKTARENGSYNDITGNLRSSIGYVVLRDGKPVKQGGLQQVRGYGENMALVKFTTKAGREVKYWAKGASGDGMEGVAAGRQFLQSLQPLFPQGIVLLVCAAMNYAVYVEAVHHKDVLTSAKLTMESLLNELKGSFR